VETGIASQETSREIPHPAEVRRGQDDTLKTNLDFKLRRYRFLQSFDNSETNLRVSVDTF
jgi:hypothetical protein